MYFICLIDYIIISIKHTEIIMNKRTLIKNLNNKEVTVEHLDYCSNDERRSFIKEFLTDLGIDYDTNCTETDKTFNLSNGQFFFKETRSKISKGILTARSSDFIIDNVYFDYKSIVSHDENSFRTKSTLVTF